MKVVKIESAQENYTVGANGRVPAVYAAIDDSGAELAYYRPAGPAKFGKHRVQARCWWADRASRGPFNPPCFSLSAFRKWAEAQ